MASTLDSVISGCLRPFDGLTDPIMLKIVKAAMKVLKTDDTINRHGLYLIHFPEVVMEATSILRTPGRGLNPTKLTEQALRYLCEKCVGPLRCHSLRQKVYNAMQHAAQAADLPLLALDDIPRTAASILSVTDVVKQVWWEMVCAIRGRQSVLLTGGTGVGKSLAVKGLAVLLNQPTRTICITSETDVDMFVGNIDPNSLKWHPGCVTDAIEADMWLLLDNLNEVEATVAERLNPVLECPPSWTIPDKGDSVASVTSYDFTDKTQFHIFATMTPPCHADNSTGSELSAALYNRFAIIHIDDKGILDDAMHADLISCFIGDTAFASEVSGLPRQLTTAFNRVTQKIPRITRREFVRFADCAYRLFWHPSCDQSKPMFGLRCILAALEVSVLQGLNNVSSSNFGKASGISVQPEALRQQFLECMGWAVTRLEDMGFLDVITDASVRDEVQNFVLSRDINPKRYAFAQAVAIAVLCRLPVLLEGPAATGKTKLVEFLSSRRRNLDLSSQGLWKVNNTGTTTVQDYVGSYVPFGDSGDGAESAKDDAPQFRFEYFEGPLITALKQGSWLLADELNLADVRVLNGLLPLFEEWCMPLPGSAEPIRAEPEFAFFATQNDTSYASRKALPRSFRSRFVEIQVLLPCL